jgi:hypothetical protein
MAVGYARIFALPASSGDSEARIPTYQFTFNEGGNLYSRVFSDQELLDFLTEDIALRSDVLAGAMDELHTAGSTMIGDLEIKPTEAAEMGLMEVPTD